MSTWIDLSNIFANRQGFGTQINIEECLHDETDVIITNDLYQQLISELNRYYDETDKIVLDLNNNVNHVKEELVTTNERVDKNAEDIITTQTNINNVDKKVEKNKKDIEGHTQLINDLDNDILDTNTKIDVVDNKYKIFKDTIAIVSTDSELRSALKDNKRIIIVLNKTIYKPTEPYLIPENTKIIGYNYPIIDCSYSPSLNNIFRNKLDGTEAGYNGSGNITIDGIEFIGQNMEKPLTCIAFAHSKNNVIKNCKFSGFNNWHNIEVCGASNVTIENNTFSNFGLKVTNPTEVIQIDLPVAETTYPWSCLYDNTACENIYIKNNHFENIETTTGTIGQHTYVDNRYHKNVVIENNTVKNVDNFVYLLGMDGLTIKGNVCEEVFNFMHYGKARVNNQLNTTIENNTVRFKQTYGKKPPEPAGQIGKFTYPILTHVQTDMGVDNLIIKNNIIEKVKDHAIVIVGSRVAVENNIIKDAGKHSIYCWCCNRCTIIGNLIFNNGLEYTKIMLGGHPAVSLERCLCTGNVGSIGKGSNYTDANCLETNNIAN